MKTVFISYSQKDQAILERFKRHIRILSDNVDFWDDSRILPGEQWKLAIERALNQASVAILFISADFFNSAFIQEYELPELLKNAESDGTVIISVIVKPCLFDAYYEINKYQAINSPAKTIIQMSEAEEEQTWVQLVKAVKHYSELAS